MMAEEYGGTSASSSPAKAGAQGFSAVSLVTLGPGFRRGTWRKGACLLPVIPAKAGISGEGARKEPHEIPAFAGMRDVANTGQRL